MDAGGKDGTIKHVFTGVNPQGVRVASFKVPSDEERAHDFLWRIHRNVPARGEVGIFNLEGTFYALKNVCAHQGSRVCLGRIVGTALPSDVYEYKYGREGQILRCPWHEWEYDITTGESLFDPNVRIMSYPVEVVDGEIVVTIGR